MNCKLTILDPTLKYWLGASTFDSFKEFKEAVKSAIIDGLIPVGNELKKIKDGVIEIETNGEIHSLNVKTTNALIDLVLKGTLQSNNEEEHFGEFLNSFGQIYAKYNSRGVISNEEKNTDKEYLESLISFFDDYPVSEDFKVGDTYQKYSDLRGTILNTKNSIEEELQGEPEFQTDESLLKDEEAKEFYEYTLAAFYTPSDKPVVELNDDLSLLRHNVSREISRQIEGGEEFYISFAKDNSQNVQSKDWETYSVSEEFQAKGFGVVGYLYKRVAGEPKRVYIQSFEDKFNGNVTLTTDPKKAIAIGLNKAKGFTYTLPDFSSERYNKVNPDVRDELVQFRNDVRDSGTESPPFKIRGTVEEYPFAHRQNNTYEKRKITASTFLQGKSKSALRLSTKEDKIVHAGNAFLLIGTNKVPLDRLALNEQWRNRVESLLTFDLYTEAEAERVVDYLNKLLDFNGGDIRFIARGNAIVAQRKSVLTMIDGKKKFTRLEEPQDIEGSTVLKTLEYARINVHKDWLDGNVSRFPFIHKGELKDISFDPVDFYLDHHATVYRQMNVKGDIVYDPILSPIFDIKTKGEQIGDKIEEFQNNPTIGDFEVTVDGEYPLLEVLKELPSIINKSNDKDALTLIGALIENPEVKSKLEGVKIKFSGRDIQGTADKDLIEIGFNQLVNPTKTGEILAHEIIHVLTSDWILFNPEHELVKEFDALIEKVPESVNKILAKAGYPKGHPLYKFEVLARLSDPKVADALKKVKSKKKNLLEDLLDLVKSILEKVFPKLKNVKSSLYTDLLESLVKIATNKDTGVKKSLPADPFDDTDAFFNDTPDDLKPLSYGYTADDISKLEDQGYSQVFLEKSVKRIDAQLTQFIYNKGLLEHLLSGNLGFDSTFENFYYSLKPRVEFLRDTKDSSFDLEKEYFRFLLKNKDFIKDYWISKTSLAKLRKPKKGDTNKVLEIDTDLTDVNLPNDPTEVLENENADKEQLSAEIMGGADVIEKVSDFDKSGTEHSSLENADKEAIAFVKILPKIQRDEKGTVLYDSPEGDPNLFVRVGTQYIKFETDEANQLVLNDYTVTWNLIANQLTNKLSLEEMLDSIDQNPNLIHTVPEIFVLRQRLSTDIKNNFQLNLNSKVERSFKTAPVPVLVLLEQEDGRMNFIDEANDLISVGGKKIDSGFLSLLNEKYEQFYDRENDEVNVLALLTTPKKDGGLGLEDAANVDKVFLTSLLGFNFHPYTLTQDNSKREVVREFEEYLYKMLIEAEKVPIGISNFIVKGDRAKGVEGQNNRLKKVLEVENEIRPLNVSMMVQNAEGELQSTLSQFNSILQYRKHYNDAKSIEELNDLVERTKNDMFEHSLTRKLLFAEDLENGEMVEKRTNVKVEVGNLNGWKKVGKGRASQGKLTIDLDGSDWLMLNFKAMVTKGDGFIENTRAETASTSYYFKLSQWGDNRDNYVPLSHSQINSQWNKKENKFDISAGSALYEIWENYLKGETSRIRKQNLPVSKWGLFNDILNTEEKAQLLEQITPEVLIPALNRFFTAEYENYSNLFEVEMGGVKSIKEGNKDVLEVIEKVGLERLKAFVVVNTMIIHTEETILFQGDISQTPKYYKRAKGVQSTGTPMSKSPSSMKFINEELKTKSFASLLGFNFQIGKNYNSAALKDDIKQSHFYDKFKQGFKESRKLYYDQLGIEYTEKLAEKDEELLKDYLKVNIGDGGAYAHPDFYASILKLAGNFSTDQRIVHEALMLEARKNAKLYFGEELAKNINQTLTKEEEARMKEGFDLMFQGKGQLPLIKFTHRNTMSNSSSVVKPEVMDKFAIFPLYPQFVHDKEVAKELLMSMMRSETGYVKFESGTKIDTNPPFDFIKAVEEGQVDVSFGESAHELQLEYLREQIKTPEKHKGKNTFGTQVRKNILAELGKIKLQGEEKKGDFKRKWEGLIQQFSLATEKEVLGRLGIKDLNGEWDFQSIDKARVAEILLEEAEARDLPINIKIYFDKYRKGKLENLETVYDLFESSLGSQQIQNLLASIIKKISIQKLNGSQYRQIASSIFSKKIMSNGKTRDLGFYILENGRVIPAECKIGMGGDFVNLLNLQDVSDYLSQNKIEDTQMDRLRALNKLLENDAWVESHKDVLTIASYRIPNQGHNSDEVMVIREFLPPMHAGEIVLPPEVTTQSGTDYDYDKMSAIVPSIDKDGRLIVTGTKGIQNEMIKTFADILLDPVNYHKLIVPNSNAIVFDFLKKELLPKLYEKYNPKDTLSPTEIVTIKRNLRQFKAVKGKNLLGIAAVWNPFTTLIQNHDIRVQDYYVKTIGFGNDTVKVYIKPLLGSKDSSLFTKNGTNKLEIISQLINVTVDMPTDDTFGLTALREEDFGAFIYSISLLNYNFEDAMYLFHQPIVLKFKTEVAKKVKQGTKRYKAITETIYELLEETIPRNKEGNIDYTKAEKSLYANLLDSYETSLDSAKLTAVNLIGEEFKVTSQQKAVLAHYIKLLDQSSHVRVAQQALNFDTSPDNNLAKTRQRQENYRDAVKSGIIPKEKINEIFNNSVISGLYVSDIMESLITEMFPILYSEENKSLFDELSKNYKQHQEVAFRKATNDFLLALVQNYGTFGGKNVTDLTIPLVEGRDKTRFVQKADELKKKFKAEGKNYRLLDILTLSVSRTTSKVNPQLILGMENHTDDKNELVEEFRELLSNKDSKKFAERLAIVGFVQSGWSKSPLYFSDLIPEEFITPIINEAVKSYQELSDIEKIGFRKAFVENFDYYEGISLGRSKHERNSDSYRLMDYRRGVEEAIQLFIQEDAKEQEKSKNEYIDFVEVPTEIKTYSGKIETLQPNQVFVFGANTEGRHGKGAALTAKQKFGAINGQSEGLQGQSYAMITKDLTKTTHPSRTKKQVETQIAKLYDFADRNKDKEFLIAYSGEGKNLNAYTPQEMANMFSAFNIPSNVVFEESFAKLLNLPLVQDNTQEQLVGKLPMQPDNISKILSGQKTITNRTGLFEDGVYELPNGVEVNLRYIGEWKVFDDDTPRIYQIDEAGNKSKSMLKDEFAQAEGFADWTDFEKNNKYSSKFISGKENRYVYSIQVKKQSYGYSQEDINSLERDNAVKQVFNENPELEAIGTVQQYSQYLNTIFPDSKVKDIVWRAGALNKEEFKELPTDDMDLGMGYYVSPKKRIADTYGLAKPVLINVKSPKERSIAEKERDDYRKQDPYVIPRLDDSGKYDSIIDSTQKFENTYEAVVFAENQMFKLGSNQDIEGFKKFIDKSKSYLQPKEKTTKCSIM